MQAAIAASAANAAQGLKTFIYLNIKFQYFSVYFYYIFQVRTDLLSVALTVVGF